MPGADPLMVVVVAVVGVAMVMMVVVVSAAVVMEGLRVRGDCVRRGSADDDGGGGGGGGGGDGMMVVVVMMRGGEGTAWRGQDWAEMGPAAPFSPFSRGITTTRHRTACGTRSGIRRAEFAGFARWGRVWVG